MKLVFMGTPQFAVPCLKKLIQSGFDIAAVVTQPDRKSGRGQKMVPPPVKQLAEAHGIPVLQFDRIKSPEGVAALKALAPDMIVTAAFGQILSKEILSIPPLGCLNVHASLLPKYRGAAPIQWAIIKGELISGVTIMYMNEGLDTGDIIASRSVKIGSDMTGGELYESLAYLGANLLIETIQNIQNGTASRTVQDDAKSSYYPPLSKALAEIDWTKPARDIHNLVRALDPVMGGMAHMNGEIFKIWRTSVDTGSANPGYLLCCDAKTGLLVGTGKGLLRIEEMQAPGGKRMNPREYLRGKSLPGSHFDILEREVLS
jgi:methionyl-tRNA formyltransferase